MTPPIPPDPGALAIVNARIFTAHHGRPWADALLVRGARIELLGTSAEVRKRAGLTVRVVDARGGLLLPSFITARSREAFAAAAGSCREGDARALRPRAPADFVLLDRDVSRDDSVAGDDALPLLVVVGGRVIEDPGGLVLP